MPIVKQDEWDECVKKNNDPYGKCAVDVARGVMKILDEEEGEFVCHDIICKADEDGELTGFLAGCVASMVGEYHSRGEEFRKQWNIDNQIGDEGEKANEEGGTLNPALFTIGG